MANEPGHIWSKLPFDRRQKLHYEVTVRNKGSKTLFATEYFDNEREAKDYMKERRSYDKDHTYKLRDLTAPGFRVLGV